jgi:predicted ester cyclase
VVVKDFVNALKGQHKMGGVSGYLTTIEAWAKNHRTSLYEKSPVTQCTTRSLVERFYDELWNKCAISKTPSVISPSLTFRGSLGDTQHVGYDGFFSYVKFVHKSFGAYNCKVIDIVVEGHKACARLSFSGIHRERFLGVEPNFKEITWSGAAFFTIDDAERIGDMWVLDDVESFRNQLK